MGRADGQEMDPFGRKKWWIILQIYDKFVWYIIKFRKNKLSFTIKNKRNIDK